MVCLHRNWQALIFHKTYVYIFQTINEVLENAFLEEKSPARKICSFVVNGQCESSDIDYLYTSDSETNISEDNNPRFKRRTVVASN